jgi:hypothetical protein
MAGSQGSEGNPMRKVPEQFSSQMAILLWDLLAATWKDPLHGPGLSLSPQKTAFRKPKENA